MEFMTQILVEGLEKKGWIATEKDRKIIMTHPDYPELDGDECSVTRALNLQKVWDTPQHPTPVSVSRVGDKPYAR